MTKAERLERYQSCINTQNAAQLLDVVLDLLAPVESIPHADYSALRKIMCKLDPTHPEGK